MTAERFDLSLTYHEADRLEACEQVIKRGLDVFVDVGTALLEVRDNRLYRAQYATFEAYCIERWGFVASRARQLIGAANVAMNLAGVTSGNTQPDSERVARELASLSPDEQREVWLEAVETAPEGRITAAHVREVAQAYKGLDRPDYVNEDGEIVAEPAPSLRSNGVPAALQMSVSNEWYTPAKYIEAARRVMGGIDLDPASNPIANETVKAVRYYTQDDDGLQFDWYGNVWMNPPYGRDGGESNQAIWSARLIEQFRAGYVTQAVMLVNAVTDRVWFAPLWGFPICFTDHRIKFYDETGEVGSPTHGNALVYLGPNRDRFAREFSQFGPVVVQVLRDAIDLEF